jgi:hypothetical protein
MGLVQQTFLFCFLNSLKGWDNTAQGNALGITSKSITSFSSEARRASEHLCRHEWRSTTELMASEFL